MRKRLLIGVLCLACVTSFAQTKKKAAKPAPKKDTPAARVAAGASQRDNTIAPLDTTPKVAITPVTAQPPKPFDRPVDGYYKKESFAQARATPYANLRESDVAFAKRVWREIDVREKMNQYLVSPKARLIDVLMDAIKAGELTAYSPIPTKEDPNGDSFSVPLTPEKAFSTMADSSLVEKRDRDGNIISSAMVAGEFNPDSVIRFRIKEDWIFDKQRGVMEPRIIGIAPMIKEKAAGLNLGLDYQPAFWVYFPAARQILVTKEAVNRNNDATSLSFDDMFMKRIFTSVIVKVSNERDERIKDYAVGIDRLYESERLKKELHDWELNLWQY
ncbi:type IX secretion system ring subunit PorN/GldN [Mucilaginibacter sp. HD30]